MGDDCLPGYVASSFSSFFSLVLTLGGNSGGEVAVSEAAESLEAFSWPSGLLSVTSAFCFSADESVASLGSVLAGSAAVVAVAEGFASSLSSSSITKAASKTAGSGLEAAESAAASASLVGRLALRLAGEEAEVLLVRETEPGRGRVVEPEAAGEEDWERWSASAFCLACSWAIV